MVMVVTRGLWALVTEINKMGPLCHQHSSFSLYIVQVRPLGSQPLVPNSQLFLLFVQLAQHYLFIHDFIQVILSAFIINKIITILPSGAVMLKEFQKKNTSILFLFL